MVLENNFVSIESGDKSIMGVEFDSELIKSVDELERKYIPVSYTHLDVYKRQPHYLPCLLYFHLFVYEN